MLRRTIHDMIHGMFSQPARRSRRRTWNQSQTAGTIARAASLNVESLESRQLLTAGEFSILGGTFGVDFDPDSDAFVRYDRQSDTLHLRVRGDISQNNLSLEVDTGFLLISFDGAAVTNEAVTLNFNDAIDFRRAEGLGGHPDFADFQITDFLLRVDSRAGNIANPGLISLLSKERRIADAERETTVIRLIRFNEASGAGATREVGEVAFARLNSPAIEIRGPENNEGLIDQDIPITIDLLNLPPAEHRVTVRITGDGDPIVQQFDFTADQRRNRQAQFNQRFYSRPEATDRQR